MPSYSFKQEGAPTRVYQAERCDYVDAQEPYYAFYRKGEVSLTIPFKGIVASPFAHEPRPVDWSRYVAVNPSKRG